ncbi:MAG: Gfo/Idh/MocA family protein [Solirubrobacteraceae bacterium]
MDRPLRVGVIGCGEITVTRHLPAYLECAPRVEVVAVADVRSDRAERCAGMFGVARSYGSSAEMLADAELDAVSICVPNRYHAEAAIAAMEAGCHVLCEKPPATSVAEAQRMAVAARRTGVFLRFGFQYRHQAEVQTLKRFIDGGELGEVYAARAHALRRRGIPAWVEFADQAVQGGGPLIDIGVHVLDTALYLMGYPEPAVVLGSTHLRIGNRDGIGLWGDWDWQTYAVEDMAVGMVRFVNGASLIVETSFAANIEATETTQVSLMGDHGGADLFPLRIYQEKHATLVDTTPVSSQPSGEDPYILQASRFVDLCRTGVEHGALATPREGLVIQRVVEGLYRSAQTDHAVVLGPAPEEQPYAQSPQSPPADGIALDVRELRGSS